MTTMMIGHDYKKGTLWWGEPREGNRAKGDDDRE
jgi:hypothetical protein